MKISLSKMETDDLFSKECSFSRTLELAPNKKATVQPLTSHLANYPSKTEQDIRGNVGEVRTNS